MKPVTRDDVDLFEKLTAQLVATHYEISTLVKRAPNDAVNEFKLKLINTLMAQCNLLFGTAYLPFAGFTVFSVEQLPTNSDVSFIVAQYLECAEKFRADHIHQSGARWFWRLAEAADGARTQGNAVPTSPPKKLVNNRAG